MTLAINSPPPSQFRAGLNWVRRNKKKAALGLFAYAAYESTWGLVFIVPPGWATPTFLALTAIGAPKIARLLHPHAMKLEPYRRTTERLAYLSAKIMPHVPH
jgi:hypothetical protein